MVKSTPLNHIDDDTGALNNINNDNSLAKKMRKKNKKAKKSKDSENKIKRTRSPYILFTSSRRPELKKEQKSFRDAATMLSEEWKNMDQVEKQVWIDRSLADKERYNNEKNNSQLNTNNVVAEPVSVN
jgi:lipid A disaccharide synthetase